MKVLISADMEGTCGVVSWVQVMPPEVGASPSNQSEYDRARRRMTLEVNAAIEGALAGGADEVIVNDSHDGMRNLLPDELHPAARYISGSDKFYGMMQGITTEGIGAVFYTGYHAKAGTPAAPLAHTWSGYVQDVRFNGLSTGEFGLNAAIAGYFGVPVTFVCGDDKAVAQVEALLGDQVVGVAVKEGLSTFSANHLSPEKARELIRAGAEKAIANVEFATPYIMPDGVRVELELDHQARIDQTLLMPGTERAGERTVAFYPKSGFEFVQMFRGLMKLSSITMSP
ncbi:MAG TPA: M55 family metallopeptidase [Thermomicrobiales bacterium]|nr:M55 family metallopeptidase [Thermomicrobiales bacterium]